MRSLLTLAVSGLLLTGSAAAAQAVGPRPSYNMQRPGEDIGPFAGGSKAHRTAAAHSAAHGKVHKGDHAH
jgi:opacity protein-like surface antigen